MPMNPTVRLPQSRPEMCNCQCPMSGSIPIYYNSGQQTCSIGTTRKRRDHHVDDSDEDRSSPID